MPNAEKWAKDYRKQKYLQDLKNNNAQFEIIQKALDDLLEKKREVF